MGVKLSGVHFLGLYTCYDKKQLKDARNVSIACIITKVSCWRYHNSWSSFLKMINTLKDHSNTQTGILVFPLRIELFESNYVLNYYILIYRSLLQLVPVEKQLFYFSGRQWIIWWPPPPLLSIGRLIKCLSVFDLYICEMLTCRTDAL